MSVGRRIMLSGYGRREKLYLTGSDNFQLNLKAIASQRVPSLGSVDSLEIYLPATTITSSSTSVPAVITGTGWGRTKLTIIVNSATRIIGRGGNGASSPGSNANGNRGGTGGTALQVQHPCQIANYGAIYGGGGGGGSGLSYTYEYLFRFRQVKTSVVETRYAFIQGHGGGGGAGGSSGGSISGAAGGLTSPGAGGSGATVEILSNSITNSYLYVGRPGGGRGGFLGQNGAGGNNGAGGTAGYAVFGNGYITWIATGTRAGRIV